MNRLKFNRCYLAGAIDRAPDGGVNWRERLSRRLRDEFKVAVLNPCDKPLDDYKENASTIQLKKKLKAEGKFKELRNIMKPIRHIDLAMVDRSDFVIVILDLNIYAFGTIEELDLANREKKPVLVICEQGKHHAPDWLFGMIPDEMIFSNEDELIDYLVYINSSIDPETFNRWLFFDFEKMYCGLI